MPLIRKDPVQTDGLANSASTDSAWQLLNGDREQRWSAARTLAQQPDGGEILAAALQGEKDVRVREAILTGLVRDPGDGSVDAILPLVRSDDASARTGALDSLRAMPRALASRLDELLADDDPDVRLLVCDLARVLPPSIASRALCALLDREAEVNVCAAAVDALAEIGGAEARPSLEGCAERFDAEPFVQFAVRAALARIGASSADRRD